MHEDVDVPEAVQRKARMLGPVGDRWLREVPHLLDDLEADWGIRVGNCVPGGNAGFLAEARTADDRPVILKLGLPDGLRGISAFGQELDALLLGDSPPYVEVLMHDRERAAVLVERLGRPLGRLGWSVPAQLDVIGRTLPRGWRKVRDAPLTTGREKAVWLRDFITALWHQLDRPCAERTVELALSYAHSREIAFDEGRAVLIHADAHPNNILEEETGSTEFRLIDPEGLLSEPEHDLAIPLRGWNEELLAGDCCRLAAAWCDQLSQATERDRNAIWEWSFIERVSSGLNLAQFGEADAADEYLRAADLLSAGDSN